MDLSTPRPAAVRRAHVARPSSLSILVAAAFFSSGAAVSAQVLGPPRNVQVDAYDRGLVIRFEPPEVPIGQRPPAKYVYTRDGGAPVDTSIPIIDAPLSPGTSHDYVLFGADSSGTPVTESAAISGTTLTAGEGLTTTRLSTTSAGIQGTQDCTHPAASADGRFIAFVTRAPEFLGESSSFDQIALLDRSSGQLQIISRSPAGQLASGACAEPSVSANGRHIAFVSQAQNLATVPTTHGGVFVYDALTGSVSLATQTTDGNGLNGFCTDAMISDDGSTICFVSNATNVTGDAGDTRAHAYVVDLGTLVVSRISGDGVSGSASHTNLSAVQEVGLNGDGSLVTYRAVFASNFTNVAALSGHWLHDRTTGATTVITAQPNGQPARGQSWGVADLTPDGRYVVFNYSTLATEAADEIIPGIGSYATIYLLDRLTDTYEFVAAPVRPTPGPGWVVNPSDSPTVSDDGRVVAFSSSHPEYDVHDTNNRADIIVRDRSRERTIRISRSSLGTDGDNDSSSGVLSADGTLAVYTSLATVLVDDDTNARADIFATVIALDPPDTNAPVWPEGSTIGVAALGATVASLTWPAATDPEENLTGYRVYLNNSITATTAAITREISFTNLSPETTYEVRIEAFDSAGNESDDGPGIDITTDALSTGDAGLTGPVLEGGRVNLTWDPASGGVAAYYVERRVGDATEWTQIAELGGGATTFSDAGLPASSVVSYRVLLQSIGETEKNLHTRVLQVTTGDLFVTRLEVRSTLAPGSLRLLARAGSMGLSLEGEQARAASVKIEHRVWPEVVVPDSEPEARSTIVPLTEVPEQPGRYVGSWPHPAGLAEVSAVSAELADGAGHAMTRAADGFPKPVESGFTLSLTIDTPAGAAPPSLTTSVWSDAQRAGRSFVVTQTSMLEASSLPPGDDYRVRVFQDARVVEQSDSIALRAGLVTALGYTAIQSVRPVFKIVDPEGEGRSGVRVTLADPATRTVLGFGDTGPGGLAEIDIADAVLPPGTQVEFATTRVSWDLEGRRDLVTVPGDGSPVVVHLDRSALYLKTGSVRGTVRSDSGVPVAGATLSFASLEPNVGLMAVVQSAADGTFVAERLYGRNLLTVEAKESNLEKGTSTRVNVPVAGEVALDVTLSELRNYTIRIGELSLTNAMGTVDRFAPHERPDIVNSLLLRVVRTGTLYADAMRRPQDGDLAITSTMPAGSDYTFTVDASNLGFGLASAQMTAGEDLEVLIPRLELSMGNPDFVVAELHDEVGQLLHARVPWEAVLARSGEQAYHVRILGFGPLMIVPGVLPGEFRLNVLTTTGGESRAMVSGLAVNGMNDLGPIRLTHAGRFATDSAFRATPTSVAPGATISVDLMPSNTFSTSVRDFSVSLPLPDGVSYSPGSLVVNDGVLAPQVSDGNLLIRFPTKRDYPGLDSDFDAQESPVFGAYTSQRARFELVVADDPPLRVFDLVPVASYTDDEGPRSEVLPVSRHEVITEPSIIGPESVHEPTLDVYGRAQSGTIVVLDGDTPVGHAEVSAAGYWNATIELTTPKTPYWHTLRALWIDPEDGSELVSQSIEVLRSPLNVRPVEVRFRQPTEEADNLEEIRLARRFPNVSAWTRFEVPPDGPARFWRQILAGFPFQFEVDFNEPESVRDVFVEVEGPTGGIAAARLDPDGVYRARVGSNRAGSWNAGPISVIYRPLGSFEFPKWGNEIDLLGELQEISSPPAPTYSQSSVPASSHGSADRSWTVPVSVRGGLITGNITFRVQSEQGTGAGMAHEVAYPYGTIAHPGGSSRGAGSSVGWSVSENSVSFQSTTYFPVSRFVSEDKTPPTWPENPAISVGAEDATSATATWTEAHDDVWMEAYFIYLDGDLVGQSPAGKPRFTLTGLQGGTSYTIEIRALDLAGRTSTTALSGVFTFAGASQALGSPTMAAAPVNTIEVRVPAGTSDIRQQSHEGDTLMKLTTTAVLNAPLIEIPATFNSLFAWDQQLDAWRDMQDTARTCGASPLALAQLAQEIEEAKESLAVQNLFGTVLTSASITATATGVGAAAGAALFIGTVGTNFILGDIADHEAAAVDQLFAAIKSETECEEEEDVEECPPGIENCDEDDRFPRPRRRIVADPVWKIDPSGFVYEVTEDNRLEGVTAILLEGESENGPWLASEAEAFGEINPQTTPAGGTYRWDVPAGWWRVMYHKEGYATTYSDVLSVPPPHFDVNVPLRSLAAPRVLGVTSVNNGAALQLAFDTYIRTAMASPDTIRVRDGDGNLLPGQTLATDADRVDNPHTESKARDIARRLFFVPDQRLAIGSSYTVEIDGVMESYGEIPLGETVSIAVTIMDDRSGTYFGTFAPGGGLWTMQLGENGDATLSGYDPHINQAFTVAGSADADGILTFDLDALTEGARLRGMVVDGVVSGTVSMLNYTVAGSRSEGAPETRSSAVVYRGAVVGSTSTTVTATHGPDRTILVIVAGELVTGALAGTIGDSAALSGTLQDGSGLELDLSDPAGVMHGTLSLASGGAWSVLGAQEGSAGTRLVNASGRGLVAAGEGSLIAGFVIRGSSANPMLIRGIGPGLQLHGVPDVLQEPLVRVVDQTESVDANLLAENAHWLEGGSRDQLRAIFSTLGAFLLNDADRDAAIYRPFHPGLYTAVLHGMGDDAGIGLVEVYDADLHLSGALNASVANFSIRGIVGTGHAVLIGGLVIEGTGPRRLLIRGVGPGLAPFGVQSYVIDPTLTLFHGGNPIADNQSWTEFLPNQDMAAIFQAAGAFALGQTSKDAAIVIWLAPGGYTVHLENEEPGEGVGLIEFYDLP